MMGFVRPNNLLFLLFFFFCCGGGVVEGKPLSITQVHLSIANGGNLGVSWACNRSGVVGGGEPVVLYTEVTTGRDWVQEDIRIFRHSDNDFVGYFAEFQGLIPGKRFCYVVGFRDEGIFSDESCFHVPGTHKKQESDSEEGGKEENEGEENRKEDGEGEEDSSVLTFAAFGDLGVRRAARQTLRQIEIQNGLLKVKRATKMGGTTLPNEVRGLDSVIHLGDFAYPKTPPTLKWTVTNPRYGKMKQGAWDLVMDMIAPLASEIPYMTLPGNHEYFPYDFGVEGYLTHFHMPSNSSSSSSFSSSSSSSEGYLEWIGRGMKRAWASLFLPRRDYPVDPALSTPPMGFSVHSKLPSPTPSSSPSPTPDRLRQLELKEEFRRENGVERGEELGEEEREKGAREEQDKLLMEVFQEKVQEQEYRKKKEQQRHKKSEKELELGHKLLSELELDPEKPQESQQQQQQQQQLQTQNQQQQQQQQPPQQQPQDPSPREGIFYSFDYSYVHFIALSSEESLSPSSPQMEWLVRDLKETERRKELGECLWTVLMVHRPMYSSTMSINKGVLGNEGSNLTIRFQLEPLLHQYQVDLVLSGHDHAYERTYPVIASHVDDGSFDIKKQFEDEEEREEREKQEIGRGGGDDFFVDPQYPVHVRVGTGGIELDTMWESPPPGWSARRVSAHGFVIFNVTRVPQKQLSMSFYSSRDGSVLDSFTIIKTPNTPPPSPLFTLLFFLFLSLFLLLIYRTYKSPPPPPLSYSKLPPPTSNSLLPTFLTSPPPPSPKPHRYHSRHHSHHAFSYAPPPPSPHLPSSTHSLSSSLSRSLNQSPPPVLFEESSFSYSMGVPASSHRRSPSVSKEAEGRWE